MRDDFKQETKDTLAKRVAFICSNPYCKMLTIGPNSNQTKSTNIGVAAHITAASKGGKRYNDSFTTYQRTSIENGIWLCQSCSKLIDTDEHKYATEILIEWKNQNEKIAAINLNKQVNNKTNMFSEMGNIENIKENGYYEKDFFGQHIRYYLQGTVLHIEHEIQVGIIVYYVLDGNGNLINSKFPFPINEYSIIIDEGLILNSEIEKLEQNFFKETIHMKWGKIAIIIRDIDGKMIDVHIEKGATIDHVKKMIYINRPEFKKH